MANPDYRAERGGCCLISHTSAALTSRSYTEKCVLFLKSFRSAGSPLIPKYTGMLVRKTIGGACLSDVCDQPSANPLRSNKFQTATDKRSTLAWQIWKRCAWCDFRAVFVSTQTAPVHRTTKLYSLMTVLRKGGFVPKPRLRRPVQC